MTDQHPRSGRNYSNWRWHLDEVFVRVNGERHYLWRAVHSLCVSCASGRTGVGEPNAKMFLIDTNDCRRMAATSGLS